jgi:hypothetical protein
MVPLCTEIVFRTRSASSDSTEAESSALSLRPTKEGTDGMRRTILLLLLGAMLAAPIVVSAAAWAATTIRCPNDPQGISGGTC